MVNLFNESEMTFKQNVVSQDELATGWIRLAIIGVLIVVGACWPQPTE